AQQVPPAVSEPPAKSALEVKASSSGIVVRTPQSEFTLAPSGALTAALVKGNATLSLDRPSTDPPQVVTIAKKDIRRVELDTANATVKDARGKLGNLGKQVEVSGKIPSTDLEETLTLEVYDAFPNLAILSMRLRNAGKADVQLDKVALQRHNFASR